MLIHLRMHCTTTPWTPWKPHRELFWILKPSFRSSANKQYEVEPWWHFSWNIGHAGLTPRLAVQPPHIIAVQPHVFVTASLRPVKIHASSLCSCGCIVAQASSDHPRWCGPDPVHHVWLALGAGRNRYHDRSIFPPSFPKVFRTHESEIEIGWQIKQSNTHSKCNMLYLHSLSHLKRYFPKLFAKLEDKARKYLLPRFNQTEWSWKMLLLLLSLPSRTKIISRQMTPAKKCTLRNASNAEGVCQIFWPFFGVLWCLINQCFQTNKMWNFYDLTVTS